MVLCEVRLDLRPHHEGGRANRNGVLRLQFADTEASSRRGRERLRVIFGSFFQNPRCDLALDFADVDSSEVSVEYSPQELLVFESVAHELESHVGTRRTATS